MFKGQAFDTFKLLIAAVIAVAILGILLGILGGIATPGQGFDDTARQLIQKGTQSPRAVFSSTGEVSFSGGDIYPGSIFETAAGGRGIDYIGTNFCGGISGCNEPCCIYTSGGEKFLEITRNFRSRLYVCCETIGPNRVCKIGVGNTVSCTN